MGHFVKIVKPESPFPTRAKRLPRDEAEAEEALTSKRVGLYFSWREVFCLGNWTGPPDLFSRLLVLESSFGAYNSCRCCLVEWFACS